MIIFKKKVDGLSESALHRFTAKAMSAVGLGGEVNVLITSSSELRSLNRRFRGKDKATDVLSFPPGNQGVHKLAGDVAVSAEMAAANGRTLGHSAADEVRILVLHGILHLAGYDHERDNGIMATKEARLRRALKLPVGLIERQHARAQSARKLKKSSGKS